jgi:thiosulfate/3-mercaptopyruvate sulfurtransferase
VNVPSASLVDPDTNTLASDEQAASIFRRVGANPIRRTVVHRGGGIAATLDAVMLHRLGYQDLSAYDASMSEWARDESLPIETD